MGHIRGPLYRGFKPMGFFLGGGLGYNLRGLHHIQSRSDPIRCKVHNGPFLNSSHFHLLVFGSSYICVCLFFLVFEVELGGCSEK